MLERLTPLLHPTVFDRPRRLTDVGSWHSHIPFAFFMVHLLRPRTFVELGTHKGDSYCAFCQEVDVLRLDTKCWAVDTWTGDMHSGFYGPEVLHELRGHHDSSYDSFSTLLPMTFDRALNLFADHEIDLLHIDGAHDVDTVRHDFESWLPKMSARGVVLLHDTTERTRDFGVWKLWTELADAYPGFELRHGHGLGVLSVGETPSPRMLELIDVARSDQSVEALFFALGDRIALSGRNAHQLEQLDAQERERAELAGVVAQRDRQLGELRAELERQRERLHELEVAGQREQQRLHELEEARADTQLLQAELNNVVQSVSWRVTAPLRAAKATLRPAAGFVRRHARASRLNQVARRHAIALRARRGVWTPPPIATDRRRPLSRRPLISIVLPTWETDPRLLRRAVDSVRRQTYDNWELCICDDGSTRVDTLNVLRELGTDEPKIRLRFLTENGGISRASNAAIELANGEFVALLDHDDELAAEALYEFAWLLDEEPQTDAIYSDEDKIDSAGRHSQPFFKPDWSPEYFRGVMYVGHLLLIRRTVVAAVGGFDSSFDGVQDYELMLRVSEQTDRIAHIPKVLYHWRKTPGSVAASLDAKPNIGLLQSKAVQAHLDRLGIPASAVPHPSHGHRVVLTPLPRIEWPSVTMVIPSRDAADYLQRCLGSIFEKTSYPSFDVIVVDNETQDADALEVLARYPVEVVRLAGNFNFSRANNLGLAQARGDFVLFLNNDTEVVDSEWLQTLVWHAELPGVGGVAPLLLYPDGTVQHAGVVLGFRGTADHVMRGFPSDADGYAGSLSCTREVAAVTAACLMTPRRIVENVGGFNEYFATHYQDVDLCLRLRAAGHRLLVTPRTMLIHHESGTRGPRYDFLDRAVLLDRWGPTIRAGDPYYNRNFSLDRTDYSVKPRTAVAAS
jgi:GT2 family glycosyltransferase